MAIALRGPGPGGPPLKRGPNVLIGVVVLPTGVQIEPPLVVGSSVVLLCELRQEMRNSVLCLS